MKSLHRPAWSLALVTLLSSQSACLSWFSDQVATGAARLSVRNVAVMVSAVNLDDACGFAAPAVNDNPKIDGEIGGVGTGVWTVNDCTIDYADKWAEISTDCEGTRTTAKGALTITVEKIVRGHVTGNPEQPIIPFESEAVTFRIVKAVPKDFTVASSGNPNWMQMYSGSLSANVEIKLVQSESNGLCSVVTPHAKISDLVYSESKVHVHTPDNSFDLEIEGSNITAVNGEFGDYENHLSGTLTIFGSPEQVPMDGDLDGLDPEYDPTQFLQNYACTEDLKLPISDSCDLTERVGEAAARLGIRNFGNLVKYLGTETTCGFESPAVLANPDLFGAVGYDGGEATYTIENCKLEFPQPTEIFTDCLGTTISVVGTAVVSGTKVVKGYRTGDPETPIVPSSSTPAAVTIEAELTDFRVIDSSSAKDLSISGRVFGTLTPKTMLDTTTGACAVATGHSRFSNVEISNAHITLNSSGNFIDAFINEANLEAVNGVFDEKENYLEGSVVINELPVVVPLEIGDTQLNPDYHGPTFVQAFECAPDTILPATEEECSFRDVLAQGAARLLVKNFGMVTKAVDFDEKCGFGNTMELLGGLLDTDLVSSYMSDEPYTASWNVDRCRLNHSKGDAGLPGYALDPVLIETDCQGTKLMMQGQASVSSIKNVTGAVVMDYPPLHPQDRRSAQFRHSEIVFDDFAAYEINANETEPAGPYLILHSGKMTGISNPITGESKTNPGSYYIKTPVAGFESVAINDIEATLVLGAKSFRFTLEDSNLKAFNGSFEGHQNYLNGMLTFNGEQLDIPVTPDQASLDPNYDQASFDATYDCKEDLKEAVPSH